ncbi:MAG: hypothetical protein HAW62_01300 [Endozoicomonadaceae bacterium]|nr:hypothetical protein [Endozoicomonadaceae bacterium]
MLKKNVISFFWITICCLGGFAGLMTQFQITAGQNDHAGISQLQTEVIDYLIKSLNCGTESFECHVKIALHSDYFNNQKFNKQLIDLLMTKITLKTQPPTQNEFNIENLKKLFIMILTHDPTQIDTFKEYIANIIFNEKIDIMPNNQQLFLFLIDIVVTADDRFIIHSLQYQLTSLLHKKQFKKVDAILDIVTPIYPALNIFYDFTLIDIKDYIFQNRHTDYLRLLSKHMKHPNIKKLYALHQHILTYRPMTWIQDSPTTSFQKTLFQAIQNREPQKTLKTQILKDEEKLKCCQISIQNNTLLLYSEMLKVGFMPESDENKVELIKFIMSNVLVQVTRNEQFGHLFTCYIQYLIESNAKDKIADLANQYKIPIILYTMFCQHPTRQQSNVQYLTNSHFNLDIPYTFIYQNESYEINAVELAQYVKVSLYP